MEFNHSFSSSKLKTLPREEFIKYLAFKYESAIITGTPFDNASTATNENPSCLDGNKSTLTFSKIKLTSAGLKAPCLIIPLVLSSKVPSSPLP